MNILFVGDVVGRPGRKALARWLPLLKQEFAIDCTVVNAENAAGGLGATPEILDELGALGVEAFTFGNHTWRKRSLVSQIDRFNHVVRPANYPPGVPGRGSVLVTSQDGRKLGVINALGRVYMEPFGCPFVAVDRELAALSGETRVILVDMHAEATSEKVAMGWHLAGRCSAVVGTHTHVQTADERILPGGTAYITDVGMSGPMDSVIGVEREAVLQKFLTGMPTEFKVATENPALHGVFIAVDDVTGHATEIQRVARFGA